MKVFIQRKVGGKEWLNVNHFNAADWFETLGYEVIPFIELDDIIGLEKDTPVVGGISNVKKALERLGITPPTAIDIPKCLEKYTCRKIWTTTLGQIHNNEDCWPVFIKPLHEGKRFTGHVIKNYVDTIQTSGTPMDLQVIASEVVKWESEYRCFILKGKVIDARRYMGDIRWYPNIDLVEQMVSDFKDAPAAYSIDVGKMVDTSGKVCDTSLVEVNDGYSLGTYGLPAFMQVKMIVARWNEMTGK
jgi:hypothetical protein